MKHLNISMLITVLIILVTLGSARNCSTVQFSPGKDPQNNNKCLCKEDYFWEKDRCVSITEFFKQLEVASYDLDLAAAVACEDN